jgi:tetratricopeptide (TPR) repeat protein
MRFIRRLNLQSRRDRVIIPLTKDLITRGAHHRVVPLTFTVEIESPWSARPTRVQRWTRTAWDKVSVMCKITFEFNKSMVHACMCGFVLFWATGSGLAQSANPSDSARWQQLLKGGKCDEAQALCTSWLDSTDTTRKVEAHKCMANVVLCTDHGGITLQKNDAGGGSLSEASSPEAVENALKHLNAALQLAPQDLSIHQGRLHLLEVSFLFDDMAKALDDSCTIYKGKEGVQPWLAYVEELFEDKQFHAALALLEVLDRHYPNSHEVLGNMGAVHAVLREDEQAIRYLKRAVELEPKDPIDNWDLAREYDFSDQNALADQGYQKALALETEPDQKRVNECLYAEFVQKKLHDPKRACTLQKASCPAEQQSACSPAK